MAERANAMEAPPAQVERQQQQQSQQQRQDSEQQQDQQSQPVVIILDPKHSDSLGQAEASTSKRTSNRRSSSTLASSSSRRSSGSSSRSISSDRSSSLSSSATSGSGSLSASKSCAHSSCVLAEPCQKMIEMSRLPSTSTRPLMILDNACGGTALATFSIFDALSAEQAEETQIIAMDNSERAVAAATHRLSESDWSERVMTLKMDMQNLDGLGQKEFDYVFTNFGLHLARDVDSTMKGLHRGLKAGGVCAFTVWQRLSWIDVLRSAIRSIHEAPAFPDSQTCLLHFSNYHAWHDPAWIRGKLADHDFAEVQIEMLPTKHRFTKEEFMDNFGGCVVAYLTKCAWGQKAAENYKDKVAYALENYLAEKGVDGLELELDALVVTAKKGQRDIPKSV